MEQQLRAEGFLKQLESVDRIIRTAEEYDMTAGVEEMDALLYQLRTWKEANRKSNIRMRKKRMELRKQYEDSGLPIPLKLYHKTNRDKEKGYGLDGQLMSNVGGNAIAQKYDNDDNSQFTEFTDMKEKIRHPNGLMLTVPPPARLKKKIKKTES